MGGTFYAVMGGARILNATRVDQSGADDANVIDWVRANNFILAVNINSGNKETDPAAYKLRWRISGGSFADLAATGEMKFGATDLVSGDPIAVGGRKCDSQAGDTWQSGEEVEGTANSDSIDLVDEYETEIHFSISGVDAQDSSLYEFELYDVTNGTSKGTCGSTLTLEVVAVGIVLDIDHEDGTFSEWDSQSGGPTVTEGSALGGSSYGINVPIADAIASYAIKVFSIVSDTIRFRFYWDPNSYVVDPALDTHSILVIEGASFAVVELFLNYNVVYGQMIRLAILDDASTLYYTDWINITDAEHYLEVVCYRASGPSSNDGSSQLWIDGDPSTLISGVDNYDNFNTIEEVVFGITGNKATTTGSWYLDELILRDDDTVIGPIEGDLAAAIVETASATDAQTSNQIHNAGIAESASATDIPDAIGNIFAKEITEAGTGVDASNGLRITDSATVETIDATEVQTGSTAYSVEITEPANASEVQSGLVGGTAEINEAGNASDNQNGAGSIYATEITEAISATDATDASFDAYNVEITEPVNATDAPSAEQETEATVGEPVSAIDASDAIGNIFAKVIIESGTAIEVSTGDIEGGDITGIIAETAPATDFCGAVKYTNVIITETGTASEVQEAEQEFYVNITESGNALDLSNTLKMSIAGVIESAVVTDTQNVVGIYSAIITETGTALYATNAVFSSRVEIIEVAVAEDEIWSGDRYSASSYRTFYVLDENRIDMVPEEDTIIRDYEVPADSRILEIKHD